MSEDSPTQPRAWRESARHDLVERFASQCTVRGSAEEVFLGFAASVEPSPTEENTVIIPVHTRVVMTLPAAKRLAMGLAEMIQRYESTFGEIPIDRQAAPQASTAGFPTAG